MTRRADRHRGVQGTSCSVFLPRLTHSFPGMACLLLPPRSEQMHTQPATSVATYIAAADKHASAAFVACSPRRVFDIKYSYSPLIRLLITV